MKSDFLHTILRFVILAALGTGGGTAMGEEISAAQWKAAAAYSAAQRGLSFLVMQHGKVLGENYPGGRSANEAQRIYSGTKGFWILAALKANEEGIIALDDSVCNTIPEWRADPLKCKVTLRQLLNFNSGLDADNQLHGNGFADRDVIAVHAPLVAQPGHAFIYGPAPLQVFHEVLKRKLAARGETPTHYLELKVLAPLGLGPQRYLADAAGNPLLATGFMLTARQWSRMGQLILRGGSPVLTGKLLSVCFQGTPANEAFGMGFWNNRLASDPGAREFDFESMLMPKWSRQDWRSPCLCHAAPSDLVAAIGSGYQRLFVIPSMDLVVVRQGMGGSFKDGEFLRLLLGR